MTLVSKISQWDITGKPQLLTLASRPHMTWPCFFPSITLPPLPASLMAQQHWGQVFPLHRRCPLPGLRLPFSLFESYHECLWTPCSVGHPHSAPTHLIIPYFLILCGSFLGFISIFMYFPGVFLLSLSPTKLHEGMDQVCFIYYLKPSTAGHRASIQ